MQQVDRQAERQAGWHYSHAEKCENINALQMACRRGGCGTDRYFKQAGKQDTEKRRQEKGGEDRWVGQEDG